MPVSGIQETVVEMRHITKEFPGIRANDDISLTLRRGEIHALLGENGAGKSTLMGVLFGLYRPEIGEILVDGKPVTLSGPHDANAKGIGMVHQHFKLVHNFTVLENIILGMETTVHGQLRMEGARKKVMALSEKYGLMIDPDARISEVTVGMQQRVEILKMLYRDNEVLIFDEPTAVLTPQEIGDLMQIMKNLAGEGKSILFITHKLNEIKEVADRCTVLRKGKYIGTVEVADTSKETFSEMMVGRKVEFIIDKKPAEPGEVLLRIDKLTVRGEHAKPLLHEVSLEVRAGEILCLAGVDGNGQRELVYALTGLLPITSGAVHIRGTEITHATVRMRNESGLGCIPEDRQLHGLVLDFSLEQNLLLKNYFHPPFQRSGFLRRKSIEQYADELIQAFDIRAGQGGKTSARGMSGGNQQKAIIAREISLNPDVLIAVQPTRGLDVGAIEYIHRRLLQARDEGKAVLLVSLDLDETLGLSDRIAVIAGGMIVAEMDAKDADRRELGLYMAGSKRGEKRA
jgi:simple sugar transport system ATP-binding protein